MIWLYDNSWWIAVTCLILTQSANSFGDAIKFGGMGMRYDFLWHAIKYSIDRPTLFFAGFFSFPIITEFINIGDWWHYENGFYYFIVGVIVSILIWRPVYKLARKQFKKIG